MKHIAIALKKGFASEKEERLSRWTLIREDGYWKPWLQRDIPMTIIVSMIIAKNQQSPTGTLRDYIFAALMWITIFAALLLMSEIRLWKSNEKQWKAWRIRKDQQNKSCEATGDNVLS
jgi:hypothetical protein